MDRAPLLPEVARAECRLAGDKIVIAFIATYTHTQIHTHKHTYYTYYKAHTQTYLQNIPTKNACIMKSSLVLPRADIVWRVRVFRVTREPREQHADISATVEPSIIQISRSYFIEMFV